MKIHTDKWAKGISWNFLLSGPISDSSKMKRNKKNTDIKLFTENLSNSKRQCKMLDSTVISRINCWQIFFSSLPEKF